VNSFISTFTEMWSLFYDTVWSRKWLQAFQRDPRAQSSVQNTEAVHSTKTWITS